MADKKSLFAGRTGDKTAKQTDPRRRKADAPPPPPSPPPAESSADRKRVISYGRGGAARGVAVGAQRREVQVKEAEDYLKQANKCLQKTITRWNPNYFSAAPLFEKAGACYRAAGEDGKATSMYIQAGECQGHDTVSAHASAAKDFREAALITERQGRNEEAAALFLRCAEAWVNADEAGRAADYLGRSAKLAADFDEDEAAERYIYASNVVVPSGSDSKTNFIRVVGATDVMVQAINFLATTNRLEECMQVVERYCILLQAESIEHSLGRMYLTYCILALARGDYVKADAVFRDEHLQSTVYLHSEECRVEEELLTAFKDLRPDLLSQVQQDRTLRRLETVIVRLAKSLRVPGDDEEDAIPARETPSGTIGDAQARVGALQQKYGAGASTTAGTRTIPPPSAASRALPPTSTASSASTSPPDPKPTKHSPTKSQPPGAAATAPFEGDNDLAKNSLFGGARKVSSPLPSAAAVKKVEAAEEQTGLPPAVAQTSHHEPSEADVDLGLGDLEATLEGSAGDDGDDLDAVIEAARREAEALGLGAGEAGSDEESDEDDIDLT